MIICTYKEQKDPQKEKKGIVPVINVSLVVFLFTLDVSLVVFLFTLKFIRLIRAVKFDIKSPMFENLVSLERV